MSSIAHIRYRSYDWEKPFDPNEFRNPKAITMLYESWLQSASDLSVAKEQIEQLRKQASELDKSQALLTSERDSLRKRRWSPFALQLVATICGGIGVNILTAHENPLYGWLFVVVSIILQAVAFLMLKSEAY